MTFWIAALVVAAVAMALIVRPLLRGGARAAPDRAEFDAAVYKAQFEEIERDRARRLIGEDEAAAARLELKRRILAAQAGRTPDAPASAPGRPSRALAAVVAIGAPAVAAALYLLLGASGEPDRPLAERRAVGDLAQRAGQAPAEEAGFAEAVRDLERHLAANPEAVDGWLLLGRSYRTLDRPRDAEGAFRRAYEVAPERSDVAAAYGEAMIVARQGGVTDEARAVLEKAVQLDPRNVQARYHLAIGRAQQGDVGAAAQGLADVLALSADDAPWRPMVQRQLDRAAADLKVAPSSIRPAPEVAALAARPAHPPQARQAPPPAAAPGPSQAEVDAARAMTPEARAQMIRGMVEGLAQRLAQAPDDLDGWRRLARAYEVLGEDDKAAQARAQIARLEGR